MILVKSEEFLGNNIDKVEIDKTEICQNLLNIQEKEKSNNFTWKGQFSPQFVSTILDNYTKIGDRVLDPFSGSGTVMAECISKNLDCIGVELNPAAYYMSAFYEISNLETTERDVLLSNVFERVKLITNMETLENQIRKNLKNFHLERNIFDLFVVLLDIYNNDIDSSRVSKIWNDIVELANNISMTTTKVKAIKGDIRTSNIEENSIDLVFTSPPYLNVFNYHQNYRRSVELLGYDILKIAKTEFGSNRKNRGNRYLTIIQYFVDMALTISVLSNFLKKTGRLIFVIGRQSRVLGIDFSNTEIIYRICKEIFGIKLCLRQERYYKNRFGQIIFEDILHFENKKNSLSEDKIVEASRKIAKDYLVKYYDACSKDFKNIDLLKQAIDKTEKVEVSEYL